MDVGNVYWLDQMGINCGMTRLYGRAFKNERINNYVPDVRFERTSVMGALGVNGMIAPLVYKGTLNGELFGVYVKEVLAPAMKKGDTIILDNLSPHKVKDILKPLIDKSVKVVFLPRACLKTPFRRIFGAFSAIRRQRQTCEPLRVRGVCHFLV